MCMLHMFFPGCGLSSDSLDTVFCRAEVCNFIEVQLISYSFHGLFLRYFILKRHHHTQGHLKFPPMLTPRSFLVLRFTLRSSRVYSSSCLSAPASAATKAECSCSVFASALYFHMFLPLTSSIICLL